MRRHYFQLLTLVTSGFCVLLFSSQQVRADTYEVVGDYIRHQIIGNNIEIECENAKVRLELCADDIVRVRMRKSGEWLPDENMVVIQYDWPKVSFDIKDKDDILEIITDRMVIKALKKPFRVEMYNLDGRLINRDHPKGGMGFEGDKVICKKELSPTDHQFGLGQRYDRSDLRGTLKKLWVTENVSYVPFFMGTDGYGIFLHSTWPSVYDFTSNPYSFESPGGGELDYYFIYGPNFKHILDQYTTITGKSPLPPKWAFGFMHSSWVNQGGQEGLLAKMKEARQKDWPLDSSRVHAKGCTQGISASPNTDWPSWDQSSSPRNWWTTDWGAFPDVKQMIDDMHDMNIHPIVWLHPVAYEGCRMAEEGLKKNYLIMQEGKDKPVPSGFGYLIDFINPEACQWWKEYHYFLVDAGSDGCAPDGGEAVRGTMYSPYNGMSGDEYHNLYSFLYDKTSWEAYKERNPNRRSITYGRSTWAGAQRYPMQGTQDSHEEGKNIHGEIQGVINFGLSGVPFRTYTDNITRRMGTRPLFPQPEKTTGIETRYSQHLCFGVAGERTEIMWSGNLPADDSYRKYGRLRYRLMPYIYTYAHQTTQTGLPLIRAMVLEYQDDPQTYDAYAQFMLGEHLLVAPCWRDDQLERDIYLPKGKWIDFYDGSVFPGGQTITFDVPLDKVPLLVKSGAIIPMAPDGQNYMDEKKTPYTLKIYPDGNTSFELYEDDGQSYDYENGVYAITEFECIEDNGSVTIKKHAPKGKYKIPSRDYIFEIHTEMPAGKVLSSYEPLPQYSMKVALERVGEGWFHDVKNNIFWIKVKGGEDKEIILHIIDGAIEEFRMNNQSIKQNLN